jgi:hypothetical protein
MLLTLKVDGSYDDLKSIKQQYRRSHETSLLADESDKLAERFVANFVGMNQLSFRPCH